MSQSMSGIGVLPNQTSNGTGSIPAPQGFTPRIEGDKAYFKADHAVREVNVNELLTEIAPLAYAARDRMQKYAELEKKFEEQRQTYEARLTQYNEIQEIGQKIQRGQASRDEFLKLMRYMGLDLKEADAKWREMAETQQAGRNDFDFDYGDEASTSRNPLASDDLQALHEVRTMLAELKQSGIDPAKTIQALRDDAKQRNFREAIKWVSDQLSSDDEISPVLRADTDGTLARKVFEQVKTQLESGKSVTPDTIAAIKKDLKSIGDVFSKVFGTGTQQLTRETSLLAGSPTQSSSWLSPKAPMKKPDPKDFGGNEDAFRTRLYEWAGAMESRRPEAI